MDIQELYDAVKPIVWVLIIEGEFEEVVREEKYTAFAVKQNLLMSCAHGDWEDWEDKKDFVKLKITARPLCSDVPHKAGLVQSRRDCDISLFRVGGKNIAVGKLGSGKLAVGETVMVLGNPLEFVGSGLVGKVSFPCVELPPFSFDESITCLDYVSTAFESTPLHRIMGHLWNVKLFKAYEKETDPDILIDVEFAKNLKALLPVIQANGLICSSGCSGAPMFNMKGEIVGMHVMRRFGYEISVHVSVLRSFLDFANTSVGQDGGPSKGELGQSSEEKQPFKKPRH